MRERINRLAKGIVDYDDIQVAFSVTRIEEPIAFDDRVRNEFRIVCENGKTVKGLVYSTNQRVSLLTDNFMGRDCRILYEVDASYAEGNIKGEFQIVSSGGEFRIPYCFHICAANPGGFQVNTLREFAEFAGQAPDEALKYFESPDFVKNPFMQDPRLRVLYDGLWGRGNRQNSMEEFLVGAGAKKPVRFTVKDKERIYQSVTEPVSGELIIRRSTAGYLYLTLSCDADFIKLESAAVNSQDFTGDTCTVPYTIYPGRLHAGVNDGVIRIRGLYGEEQVHIQVTLPTNRTWADGPAFKKDFLNFVSLYLRQEAGEYEKNLLLNSMQTALSRAHAAARYPAVIRLYQAEVYLLQGKREQADQMLEEAKLTILDNRDRDVSSYCYYMFLKARKSGETAKVQSMVKLLRKYYEEGVAQDMAFYILMQTDPELLENDSLALSRLKAHFRTGCRSPYLYLGACRLLNDSPELLRVLEEFEIHSLWFGAKHHMVTEKLAKAASILAIQAKKCRGLCLRFLMKLYEDYPCREILTGICALLIRENRRGPEAFSWYVRGVEEDIHLTRLYEYYLYALPADYEGPLPRVLLLYFSYNHTLDYHARAALYLNVLTYMKDDAEVYRAYESQIEDFAVEQVFESHMNRALADIYSQMIFPEMVDEKIARVLPKLLYAREIRCSVPDMRQAVFCYEEMKGETTATLRGGRAYVPVYLDHVHVLFQDDFGNRYSSIPYTMEPMMDCRTLKEQTAKINASHEMMRLIRCREILEQHSYSAEDIEILKDISQEENIHELFRKKLVSEIVAYYYKMEETAECDEYFLSIDKKLLSPDDRQKVMDALVTKDYYEEAYRMAARYGYRGLGLGRIMKLATKMILKVLFERDSLLLEMAWYCFSRGRGNDVIVEYLCSHYNGLGQNMYRVLEAAVTARTAVYDMPERLLGQMLFDGVYCHLDEVFRLYIEGKTVDESLVKAYLVVKSSRYFEEDERPDEDIFSYIEAQMKDSAGGLPEICMLALVKYYSCLDRLTDSQVRLCQEMVDGLYQKRIIFGFYQKLAGVITLPRELQGKTVIEYHRKRRQSVWIHQRLLPDGGETVVENIPHMFDGYFVKLVSLFYGETLEYEIYDDSNSEKPVMKGTVSYSRQQGTAGNRAGQLDELLRMREAEPEGFREKMTDYAVRDEMTEKLFEYL